MIPRGTHPLGMKEGQKKMGCVNKDGESSQNFHGVRPLSGENRVGGDFDKSPTSHTTTVRTVPYTAVQST